MVPMGPCAEARLALGRLPTSRTCKEMFLGDSALGFLFFFPQKEKPVVTSECLWRTSQINFALGVSRQLPHLEE